MIRQFFYRHRPFFLIDSNFILRVAPLKKHHQQRNYFPPPGYGVPDEKKNQFNHTHTTDPVTQYGFYLTLGRLARDYLLISTLMALCLFSPLLMINDTWNEQYLIAITLYLLLSGGVYLLLYRYLIPPVLSDVWRLWPEPFYRLLQSVPHKVTLARSDRKRKNTNLYWNPKPSNIPLSRQPQQYAKDTPTLQNVLLDFAIFELFFFKKAQHTNTTTKHATQETKNSTLTNLDGKKWLYWLSPIIVNYFALLIMLPITWFFYDNDHTHHYPILPKQALSLSIIVWAGSSYWFMKKRLLKILEQLQEKVENNYFVQHLNFVPQPILKHMNGIPQSSHIESYINDLHNFLSFMMFFAVISYIGIIDASF